MARKYYITVLPSGYGHWKITSQLRGKLISGITTDSQLIDRYSELKDDRSRGILAVEKELHRIASK